MWVYGLPEICEPLAGIALPPKVLERMRYTGYLRRTVPAHKSIDPSLEFGGAPFLLVTPGGGGDGEGLIDWILSAYETDRHLPYPALLVFGPFMQPERQTEFLHRAAKLPRVKAITFDTHLESLMTQAAGVVAMGGYNTFCEILSFDKRALIVPRTKPRLEQFIRAERAAERGLVRMLVDDGRRDPEAMATALRALPQQRPPSEAVIPGLLDGLDSVNRLTEHWLYRARPRVEQIELWRREA
jgi:predicted glycosyltransferase